METTQGAQKINVYKVAENQMKIVCQKLRMLTPARITVPLPVQRTMTKSWNDVGELLRYLFTQR